MLEHIGNCHGEWSALFMVVSSLPFIGFWVRYLFRKKPKSDCSCGHEGGEQH
jgi:hypothetical protein